MNSRTRFKEILRFNSSDRIPLLPEGIRDEVYKTWHTSAQDLWQHRPIDYYEFLMPLLDPMPAPRSWPQNSRQLKRFSKRLNPNDKKRFDSQWYQTVAHCQNKDIIRLLRVHRGFFLSLGVEDWHRFESVICLLLEEGAFVAEYMQHYGEFVAQVLETALEKIEVDAVYFSEPIGGNDLPLVSPKTYKEIILSSYQPALNILKQHNIDLIIYLSYSNVRALLPDLIEAGFNCLWACETESADMDYNAIRAEFGHSLGLIGGIGLSIFNRHKNEMQHVLSQKISPLLADGGFIPLVNGRVRQNISLKKYLEYRDCLSNIIHDF